MSASKEIEEGLVSKQLKRIGQGRPVEIEGPVGFFSMNKKDSSYTRKMRSRSVNPATALRKRSQNRRSEKLSTRVVLVAIEN